MTMPCSVNGLRNIISVEEDIEAIGEAVSGDDALLQVEKCKPDMVLMDINMPLKNGVEVTGILKKKYPHIKVLVLTMHSHEEYFMSAIRVGADGYLLKDAPSDQVVRNPDRPPCLIGYPSVDDEEAARLPPAKTNSTGGHDPDRA